MLCESQAVRLVPTLPGAFRDWALDTGAEQRVQAVRHHPKAILQCSFKTPYTLHKCETFATGTAAGQPFCNWYLMLQVRVNEVQARLAVRIGISGDADLSHLFQMRVVDCGD